MSQQMDAVPFTRKPDQSSEEIHRSIRPIYQDVSQPMSYAMTRSGTSSSRTSLLDLPAELRLNIYRHLLVVKPPPDGRSFNMWRLTPSILRVTRQVYEETTPILYEENAFISLTLDQQAAFEWYKTHGALSRQLFNDEQASSSWPSRVMNINFDVARPGQHWTYLTTTIGLEDLEVFLTVMCAQEHRVLSVRLPELSGRQKYTWRPILRQLQRVRGVRFVGGIDELGLEQQIIVNLMRYKITAPITIDGVFERLDLFVKDCNRLLGQNKILEARNMFILNVDYILKLDNNTRFSSHLKFSDQERLRSLRINIITGAISAAAISNDLKDWKTTVWVISRLRGPWMIFHNVVPRESYHQLNDKEKHQLYSLLSIAYLALGEYNLGLSCCMLGMILQPRPVDLTRRVDHITSLVRGHTHPVASVAIANVRGALAKLINTIERQGVNWRVEGALNEREMAVEHFVVNRAQHLAFEASLRTLLPTYDDAMRPEYSTLI